MEVQKVDIIEQRCEMYIKNRDFMEAFGYLCCVHEFGLISHEEVMRLYRNLDWEYQRYISSKMY